MQELDASTSNKEQMRNLRAEKKDLKRKIVAKTSEITRIKIEQNRVEEAAQAISPPSFSSSELSEVQEAAQTTSQPTSPFPGRPPGRYKPGIIAEALRKRVPNDEHGTSPRTKNEILDFSWANEREDDKESQPYSRMLQGLSRRRIMPQFPADMRGSQELDSREVNSQNVESGEVTLRISWFRKSYLPMKQSKTQGR
jgi:hypothetical protein